LVEFVLSLPRQDKEELMMLVGMYATEWNLPKQDKEELMMLLGMYAMEWEKRAREERERQVGAEQARLARLHWSAGEDKQLQTRPQLKTSAFRKLLAALG